ncbi:hypothetical protein [Paenibacillus sp. yr247]|uniref:hypothetical protein n=1 Tax=Paenibacillus sp. yr247 TaxID=1761880 RepID=UPI001C31A054|nr:hypothetical protein [Paenibacillus sp. yr247]
MSSEFNISIAIVSLILGILFFLYQEFRQRKQVDKETIRLTEEIVNLIIRNCVNKKLSLSQINLNFMLDGFMYLKNCEFKYTKEELIKMVYAKVYENEHISDEIRPKLLFEIEEIINSLHYNESAENTEIPTKTSSNFSLITTIFTSILTLIVPVLITKIEGNQNNLTSFLFVVVILTSCVTAVILIARTLKSISTKTIKLNKKKNNLNNINENEINLNTNVVLNNLTTFNGENEISLDRFTSNEYLVIETFKKRYILEKLITNLFNLVTKEDRKFYSVNRMVGLLNHDNILDTNIVTVINDTYRWTSHVIHGDELKYNEIYYREKLSLIDNLAKILINKVEEINQINSQAETIEDDSTNKSA